MDTVRRFSMKGKFTAITGGAGLLGRKHAEAVLDAGGNVALLDVHEAHLNEAETSLAGQYGLERIQSIVCDITNKDSVEEAFQKSIARFGRVDVLVNNASNNPKVEHDGLNWSRFENFPLSLWEQDIAVGLTGSFLCAQVFGTHMAKQKGGVIINISSDLGIIAPDQRLYRKDGVDSENQPVKPVTYSVVKHAMIGLTKYLATYWAEDNVRVNAVCPGGVYNGQDQGFVEKIEKLIPMGRMAAEDEYKGIILFLASDASTYMTGSTIVIDGGRTCW